MKIRSSVGTGVSILCFFLLPPDKKNRKGGKRKPSRASITTHFSFLFGLVFHFPKLFGVENPKKTDPTPLLIFDVIQDSVEGGGESMPNIFSLHLDSILTHTPILLQCVIL